jgi:hypothetical protein
MRFTTRANPLKRIAEVKPSAIRAIQPVSTSAFQLFLAEVLTG